MSQQKANEVFSSHYLRLVKKVDHLFVWLLLFQWGMGVVFAIWISPFSWEGSISQTHIHVYAAVFLGGLLALFPTYLVAVNPGHSLNRIVISIAQILFSVLFIHLMGGRIETHFHIFGSLAFLAIYRDWRVIIIGTALTALDHLVRGWFWPQSVYGVLSATPWRAIEHAAWVVFEDVILLFSIRLSLMELHLLSRSQAELEETIANVELQVSERTEKIRAYQNTLIIQQQALMTSSKMSALGEMAGGVAHEINNPLATIKSLASQLQEVLQDESIDVGMVREMAAKIEKTLDRISKIVLGLRQFSRDGSGDSFTTVPVCSLIDDTFSFCNERFMSKGIHLRVIEFPKTLSFEGRFTEVSQVLLNLLNNACDAVEGLSEKWIEVSARESDSWLEIRVKDSGNGLTPEARKKLFQPFFTTKAIGKGVGIGLSVASGIVKNHAGELFVDETSPNTCFVIRLPKVQSRAA